MKKILSILIHEAPYKNPLMDSLDNNEEINLKNVVLYDKPTTHKEWNIKNKNNNAILKKKTFPIVGDVHYGAIKIIREFNPDLIIISGYYPIINAIIIFYCIKNNIKYLYGFDTVEKSHFFINNILQKFFINKSASLLINGKKTEEYINNSFKKKYKLINGFYCLNIHEETIKYEAFRIKRSYYRNKFNIKDNKFVFLFVGKLITSRRIADFLTHNLMKLDKEIVLMIIGDGEESGIVDSYVKQFPEKIIHIKNVEYSELYKYYTMADGYFHPGKEPYSLAFVQAILSKLPIVSSNDVGAVYDFLNDAGNGYIIKDNNIGDYFYYMNRVKNKKYNHDSVTQQYEKLKEMYNLDKISRKIIKLIED